MAANVNARSELIMVVERAYAAWAADEAPNPMGGWAQVVDAVLANPDVVLRALGGKTAMTEIDGHTFRIVLPGYAESLEVPDGHGVWLIPERPS